MRMDKVLIASSGVEGGGARTYGTRSAGIWTSWTKGTMIDLDDNDEDVWRSWSSGPAGSLDVVVPKEWPLFYPFGIHPEFVGWFRAAYEKARSRLPEEMRRYQSKDRHGRWVEVLGLAG
jgi:hypothetical protein